MRFKFLAGWDRVKALAYYNRNQHYGLKQGWLICMDDDGKLKIMKYDEDPEERFRFDEEAICFVLKNANRRKLCRAAIAIVYCI